jgi:tetrahydromethanopterin S-methyltransferase subunit G
MSTEMEKIKKRLDELEADIKKHTSGVMHTDKKRLDEIDARLKALEEKVKKKL